MRATSRFLYLSSSSAKTKLKWDSKKRVLIRPPHPRNAFQGKYNLDRLVSCYPALGQHVIIGPTGRPTVDWADPVAVRALNTSLLVADYGVNPKYADILPPNALMAGVPGRADYVHHIADRLQEDNGGAEIPKGRNVIGMDIGTGASCIYPLIATSIYGWSMIATDINRASIESAQAIVESNNHQDKIEIRHQLSDTSIFNGILKKKPVERIDFAMCNPPFYPSKEAFQAENARKIEGLAKSKMKRGFNIGSNELPDNTSTDSEVSSNNFGGTDTDLWCDGGEMAFVKRIYTESTRYWNKCLWFSSLVSRKKNLNKITKLFKKGGGGKKGKGVEMVHRIAIGRKEATILMWTFMDEDARRDWAKNRWNNREDNNELEVIRIQ